MFGFFRCKKDEAVVSSKRHQEETDHFVSLPFSQRRNEMATKINRAVMIHGEKKWIHANTE